MMSLDFVLLLLVFGGQSSADPVLPMPPPDAVELFVGEQDSEQLDTIQFKQSGLWPSCPSIEYYNKTLDSSKWRRCGFSDGLWDDYTEGYSGSMNRVFRQSEAWIANDGRSSVVVVASVSLPDGTVPEGELMNSTTVFLVRGEAALQSLMNDLFGRQCDRPCSD